MDEIGKKLLEVAKGELGYTEKADGYTKFGDWFAKNVDADHDAYFKTAPWCDMFLAWAANEAGIEDSVGEFAGTVQHAKWFEGHGAWGTEPEVGAIVFFDWSGSNSIDRIDHVGIVEKIDGKKIHTIEANVDGIHLKRKVRDDGIIVGYGYPAKVKVTRDEGTGYVPKHAAPPPSTGQVTGDLPARVTTAADSSPEGWTPPLAGQETAVVTGALALILVGSVALAVGKSRTAKFAASPPVRVRKRGKHHRTPVELPVDMTPADLDAAEAGTEMMPIISAVTAAEAEDREFWGKISTLQEDEELAFWGSLHAELAESPHESLTLD
ncbi:CHAP domain-containing protein [Actinomadura craniellae]|uniref:CHAP domain-containing protein n=1 Tax=Actinomadura craniellae TaxID=2231787 RepID=A0A365GWK6_9ACTN|nr:CHAP domain-containing protein [Actinomadura craniellae]RAY11152.1 CHAP domain-containing protein [Actinomadura craniellae]